MINGNEYIQKHPITIPFGSHSHELTSLKLYHVEDAYKNLQKLVANKEFYCSDDFSKVGCTLERLYRGIIEEYDSIHGTKLIIPDAYSHDIAAFARIIDDNIIPLGTRAEVADLFCQIGEIAAGYSTSRYKHFYTFGEFKRAVELLSKQRQLLYSQLDKDLGRKEECELEEDDYII